DNDLDVMRRIDELFLRWPFLGSRRLMAVLAAEGVRVNRKRVQRLMRLMGIAALGPKPRTSKPSAGHRISMDRKGRWMDNVFIERLWRSLKYEDLYIKGYADGAELRAGLGQWFDFYNHQRPHMALDNRAPMAVWREAMVGVLPPTAVDMTLLLRRSLDNAAALPTSPQPQQQQVA
ncbi:MAG: hypothetical protein B7X09_00395, partial [Acidiphilium sp. 21-66-27]